MSVERRWRSFNYLPRAHGIPVAHGRLREQPDDFLVEELLGFEPDGEGEHTLLRLRKTDANTEWVARQLARFARVPVSAVGYAGLKDRRAVATQWFSIHVPGVSPDWEGFRTEGVEVRECHRHRKKLRRGALLGNRFVIRVRDLTTDPAALRERWKRACDLGVPNYFGPQRFGKGDGNLAGAQALFARQAKRVGRHLRGLWLSAARSQLFNEVLAVRVERGDWDRPLSGDRMQLAGSRSHFLIETPSDDMCERTQSFDIDPTGPLWGAGELGTAGDAAALELAVLQGFPAWTEGLVRAGLGQERRPLRLRLTDPDLGLAGGVAEIAFTLRAGGFATAVLRELLEWFEPD